MNIVFALPPKPPQLDLCPYLFFCFFLNVLYFLLHIYEIFFYFFTLTLSHCSDYLLLFSLSLLSLYLFYFLVCLFQNHIICVVNKLQGSGFNSLSPCEQSEWGSLLKSGTKKFMKEAVRSVISGLVGKSRKETKEVI